MARTPPSWRTHTGFIAWPTVALAVAIWLAYGACVFLALTDRIPLWAATPMLTVCVYLAFTPMHEAAHANVSGSVRGWRWLDPAIGWAMSLLFASPFPAFRAIHLRHHGRTNHVGDDPDLWVAGSHLFAVIARCWTIFPHYDWVYVRRLMWLTPAAQREGRGVIAVLLLVLGLCIALTLTGYGWQLATLWLLPVWFASGFLALAFDWLPHVPHGRTGRYVDTRAIDVRWLDPLLLGQNLHAVHHLYPRVPFYRYRPTFDAMAPEFEAKGTEILLLGDLAAGRGARRLVETSAVGRQSATERSGSLDVSP